MFEDIGQPFLNNPIDCRVQRMGQRLGELNQDRPVAVYCDSGYRASLGTSILQQHGFHVHNVPGSWQAWKNAKYPVEK